MQASASNGGFTIAEHYYVHAISMPFSATCKPVELIEHVTNCLLVMCATTCAEITCKILNALVVTSKKTEESSTIVANMFPNRGAKLHISDSHVVAAGEVNDRKNCR